MLLTISLFLLILILYRIDYLLWIRWFNILCSLLFPTARKTSIIFISLFICLSSLNLTSIILYTYPVTTTLGFNLRAAMSCWLCRIFLQSIKFNFFSAILPQNSPWYLIPFLCLVELVSISVRPITLCFRLLANIVAGHVLISLICKMQFLWTLGRVFRVLELAVAVVQAFVFSILVSVYLEEAITH